MCEALDPIAVRGFVQKHGPRMHVACLHFSRTSTLNTRPETLNLNPDEILNPKP